MSPEKIRRASELAEEWVRDRVVDTIVVLVARHGRIVLLQAYGPQTLAPGSPPASTGTLFNTASLGKVITAAAVMILVEQGRIGLNRPVASYLPEFQGEGKEGVLVRHLLTHTSGLRDEDVRKFADETKGKMDIPTPPTDLHPVVHEYLARRYQAPLWKPPGAEMSYSPYSYELLGEIVRRVAREPIDRFAQHTIFEPLEMNDTSYCEIDIDQSRRSELPDYVKMESEPEQKARRTERLSWASGSTITSASDMATFCQLFLNGGSYGDKRILSPASVAAMTRNQIPGVPADFDDYRFREASWGFGWSVHGEKTGLCGGLYSPQAYEHWGHGGIYAWVDPVYDLVGIYFTHTKWQDRFPDALEKCYRADLFTDVVTAACAEP